ncbi:MAG: RNA-binding domain-containing protein [Methanosarcinaceae archaeon]|nr:RNA-binding domain-containing protein [Methanosarcinaceae archaeon]
MIKVEVSAIVNPTEDIKRVSLAIFNMFKELETAVDESMPKQRIVGHGDIESLFTMHNLLRQERQLDTARTQLNKGHSIDGLSTDFMLNKQVATVNRLNFPAIEEPLGSIHVTITASSEEELEHLKDWLAPKTEDGVPLIDLNVNDI